MTLPAGEGTIATLRGYLRRLTLDESEVWAHLHRARIYPSVPRVLARRFGAAPEPEPPGPAPNADLAPLDLEQTATRILGPLCLDFARWVHRHLVGSKRAPIFTLLRDGHLLGRILHDAYAVPSPELWLSRSWCLLASLRGPSDFDGLQNLFLRSPLQPPTCSAAARSLDLADAAAFHGAADAPLTRAHLQHFVRTTERHPGLRKHLNRRIRHRRTAVLAHLRAAGWTPRRPLRLLDVGYSGTVQRCLRDIFELEGLSTPIEGFYVATSPGALWASSARSRLRGYRIEFGFPSKELVNFLPARFDLELGLSLPCGPLRRLTLDGRPQLDPSPYPDTQRTDLHRLQQQARSWATAHAHLPDPELRAVANSAFTLLYRSPTPLAAFAYDDAHSGVHRP